MKKIVVEPKRNEIHFTLKGLIDKHESVLDVGCGAKHYRGYGREMVTLDAWKKTRPDYRVDIARQDLPFIRNAFDVVMMIDVIEHLEKDRGFEVLQQCLTVARNAVFVFTPLVWMPNEITDEECWAYGCPYNNHKSLWSESDFGGFQRLLADHSRYGKDRAYFGVRDMTGQKDTKKYSSDIQKPDEEKKDG